MANIGRGGGGDPGSWRGGTGNEMGMVVIKANGSFEMEWAIKSSRSWTQ